MPIKGNIGGMTGYLRGSPDLLRPQDTGVVGSLTDPRFTRVNLKKIPTRNSRISVTPISESNANKVTKFSRKIVKQAKK